MVDFEPSAAERARTILAIASSLSLTAGDRCTHLTGRNTLDPRGRLRLDVPAGSQLPAVLDDIGEAPALVDLTDIAPVAMRQRVRARLTVAGWLTRAPALDTVVAADDPDGPGIGLQFEPFAARLVEEPFGRITDLDGTDITGAEPDPLAGAEADLLCHLAHSHTDAVEQLTRLVPAEKLQGVRAVHPLRLDRYGIVLRLEDVRRDRDARLPFGNPAQTVAEAPARMLELLRQAHRCRRHAR